MARVTRLVKLGVVGRVGVEAEMVRVLRGGQVMKWQGW